MKYLTRPGVYGLACIALLILSASQASAQYLLDLAVVEGQNASLPAPWQKINTDLNTKVPGSRFLYLFKKVGTPTESNKPISRILILQDRNPVLPVNWTKLPVDLNLGTE